MAAWAVVNARVNGRDDIVFGATLNGRHLVPDSSNAAGCFIVTVPLRVQLGLGSSLGEILRRLRDDQTELRPYEQTPLTAIREKTEIPRDRMLFDTAVMYETATLDQQMKAFGGAWSNRTVELFEEGDVPVTLAAYHGDALRFTVEYDPVAAPHGPELASRMLIFLQNLEAASPDTPLAQIHVLTELELDQAYQDAGVNPEAERQIVDCLAAFEDRAARQPTAIALRQPGAADMSYGELDQTANRLANLLIKKSVRPGDVVGICASRSAAFVSAILAIWKTGAAFVPMDPAYPIQSLQMIAAKSGAKLVLTDTHAPKLDIATVDLQRDLAAQPSGPPDKSGFTKDRLAYVIFTSGSSGVPKGVMISHTALAAHCEAVTPIFGLHQTDRVLQFASPNFDVAIEEILPTMLAGATLVLRSAEMAESAAEFLRKVDEYQLTVLNLPTGFWVALTDVLEQRSTNLPSSVRLVIVGGERVPMAALKRWRRIVPDVRWMNGYGLTETTITNTLWEYQEGFEDEETVPIGKPVAHTQCWVLSGDGALVPAGGKGQLWVTGPGLASGYVNAPDLTSDKFGLTPFDPNLGQAYATGDRATWRDGTLRFAGRMDRQLKLRGYRIDPEYVESVLEGIDGIARAHVDVHRAGERQDARLTAWYSLGQNAQGPGADEIRQSLSNSLPAHYLPDLLLVENWPETPGGKIDTKLLPKPAISPKSAVADTGSTTPLTDEVADLMGKLLPTDKVGPDSSFFDLGGDSLLLLRLGAAIEEQFGTSIALTSILGEPTPRGIVRALQEQDSNPLVVVPIQPKGSDAPLYAVHALGENYSFFRPLGEALGREQPLFGLTLGLMNKDMPTSVEDIARYYLHQIERHQPEGPLSLIAVSVSAYITFELAQQLQAAGRDVSSLIFLDAAGPGGRPRKSKMGHFLVHAQQVLRRGWPYLANLMEERRGERAHTIAMRRLQEIDILQSDNPAEAIETVEDFIAANEIAIAQYTPQPYEGRITIFRADDPFDSQEARENALGWKDIASQGVEVIDMQGGHITMLFEPHVGTLASQLRSILGQTS